MKQIGGDNSQQIQAATVNVGMSYTEVKDLCQTLVQSELAMYKQDAYVEAEKRFNAISDNLLERMTTLEDSTRQRFQEPAIQFAVNETMKEYIRSGKPELCDDLIDLMIDRLKVDEHTTKQSLIDEARQILPKLSSSTVAVLALLVFAKLVFFRDRDKFNEIVEKLTPLVTELGTPQSMDIAYLEQARCGQSLSFVSSNKSFLEMMRNTYNVLFTHAISLDVYNQFMQENGLTQGDKLPLMLAMTSLFETKGQSLIYKYTTFSKDNFAGSVKEDLIRYFSLLRDKIPSYSDDEIIQYFIGKSPNWRNVISLFDRADIKSFMLSPIGVYIGTRKLSRVLGEDVPISIFYKG